MTKELNDSYYSLNRQDRFQLMLAVMSTDGEWEIEKLIQTGLSKNWTNSNHQFANYREPCREVFAEFCSDWLEGLAWFYSKRAAVRKFFNEHLAFQRELLAGLNTAMGLGRSQQDIDKEAAGKAFQELEQQWTW